jgi:hypothetical protein
MIPGFGDVVQNAKKKRTNRSRGFDEKVDGAAGEDNRCLS